MQGNESIRTAALHLLFELNEKEKELSDMVNSNSGKSPKWILTAWALELQMVRNSIQWIRESIEKNEFDF